MTKDSLIDLGISAAVVALAACIPTGLVLAVYLDDVHWLWLCLPLLIFLS